jgi:hypothetical protein
MTITHYVFFYQAVQPRRHDPLPVSLSFVYHVTDHDRKTILHLAISRKISNLLSTGSSKILE